MNTEETNIVPNWNFKSGEIGSLPDGWEVRTAKDYPYLKPKFELAEKNGEKVLVMSGNGNDDCCGWIQSKFPMETGKTYRLRVVFKVSKDINPQFNLMFCCYADNHPYNNHGIFHFHKLDDGWIEGEDSFFVFGNGSATGDVRLLFRYSAQGEVCIKQVSLQECEPAAPRSVRLAATHGRGSVDKWAEAIDSAAADGVDLVLLPETFLEIDESETMDGPSVRLMAEKSKEHGIYVAGSLHYLDPTDGRSYNAGMLFDRKGDLAGKYYKIHLHTPEATEMGLTPGLDSPVWETDFGTIGMIICYDGWFGDVTRLLALKGAEVVLWPAAGAYKGLIHARSADNGIIMLSSTLGTGASIFDACGDDIINPTTYDSFFNGKKPYSNVKQWTAGDIEVVAGTFNLNELQSPANYGHLWASPGGYRNQYESRKLLYNEIQKEAERWWDTRPSRGYFPFANE